MEKTAKGLVAYAKAQLGKPYWYGTWGKLGTKAVYDQKKKQYPTHYLWAYSQATATQKVHDCVGLIKGYLWSDSPTDPWPTYLAAQDKSANGMYNACKKKGKIATLPEVPGVLVFYSGHVGIYIGGGEVIEARGHKYGVVKTKLSQRKWKNWGYCPYITYAPVETKLTVDGKWGKATTTRLQEIFGTTVDGVVSNQWAQYETENPGLTSGWDWEKAPNGKGSDLIRAMQKWAGMTDCDGEIGPQTIRAFQKKLGTTVDGYVSYPSQMVKALQRWAQGE